MQKKKTLLQCLLPIICVPSLSDQSTPIRTVHPFEKGGQSALCDVTELWGCLTGAQDERFISENGYDIGSLMQQLSLSSCYPLQETLHYPHPPWWQSRSWTWMTTVPCWWETTPGSTCARLVGRTRPSCWPHGTATGHSMGDGWTSPCAVMPLSAETGS